MFVVTPNPMVYLTAPGIKLKQKTEFFEAIRQNFCAVICVADTPCSVFEFQWRSIPAFWFPIIEFDDWGYEPFFAALRVAEHYGASDRKPILIHCHQGAHRSPLIAFVIMRLYGMTEKEIEKKLEYPGLTRHFKTDMEQGRIPEDILEFLKIAHEHCENSIKDIGQVMGKKEGFYRTPQDNTSTMLGYMGKPRPVIMKGTPLPGKDIQIGEWKES